MAMKDKSGKPKPRPVPVNKRKTAASNKKAIEDMDFDITLVDTVKKENSTRAQSAMKPKVKPTSVKMETVTPFSKKEGTKVKPSTNKPKKAVWQRDSFMANVNLQKQSTPARAVEDVPDPISEDSSQAPPGAFDFDSEPVAVEISDETTGGSETFVMDPPLAEYFVPIKGEPESSPIFLDEEPMVVKKEDAVMIDLTSPPNTTKTPARVATPAPVVTAKRPLRSTRARSEMKPEPKPEAIRTEKTREENVVERSLRLEPKPNVRKEMTGEEKAVEEPQRVLVKLEARKDKVREEKIVQRPVRIEVEPEVRAEKPQEEKVIAQPHYIEVEPEEETHAKRVVNEQRRSEVQPARMPEKIALQTPGGAWPDRAHIPIPETGKRTQIPKLTLPSLRPLANVQARFSPPRRMKEPIMDIPEILGKINEALVDRIQGKFDKTRNEMTLAQLALLEQAADDLRPLSKECAISFNELVDLEEEYATHRRKIMNSIDTFGKTANQAAGTVKQITQDHSRYGLSKKLPPKVFSKPFQLRL
ncbi:hypothetical protein DFP72DRAFT_325449 [Ephemerocybe angulata]|uniref:Uncharacterized protein n=1 Tax=Ephemerocybe angulata TaxID=980116 RepID=A0A8H6IG88_9AGAR|nr:hypothetical protein DFP72DRAFT_325449 [Tulosesus angulatus]